MFDLNNPAKITQKINVFSVWCDGGSRGNPGPGASAFVIKNDKNEIINKKGILLGTTTNNIAEYTAVLEALKWLKENFNSLFKKDSRNQNTLYNFYIDSRLVVSQLNGLFKIKDSNLREIYLQIKILENEINSLINYQLIPREKNFEADKLVNETLDNQ